MQGYVRVSPAGSSVALVGTLSKGPQAAAPKAPSDKEKK